MAVGGQYKGKGKSEDEKVEARPLVILGYTAERKVIILCIHTAM